MTTNLRTIAGMADPWRNEVVIVVPYLHMPCGAQMLLAVPDDIDDVAAAQAYVNPQTAMGIVDVRHAALRP